MTPDAERRCIDLAAQINDGGAPVYLTLCRLYREAYAQATEDAAQRVNELTGSFSEGQRSAIAAYIRAGGKHGG